MTWTVHAGGAAQAPSDSAEQKLHDELSAVLAKPEYRCDWSEFSGDHVAGNCLHVPQDGPGIEHVHETGDGSSHAKLAYEGYVRSCGGKSVHGEDLPSWGDQSPEIRRHWQAAVHAAISAYIGA